MESSQTRNKRLAKNTVILYLRMVFTSVIGLFTSRIVLQQLGITDYGIYNVVGGVVVMFSFLQSALSTGTTRFISYSLGKGDKVETQKTYSMCYILHLILALIVLLFAETIGLWFLLNYIVIPEDSVTSAFWVYQISVFSIMLSIICIPDSTLIIAHEQMNIFAYISFLDSLSRLGIAYLLSCVSNKLVVYALLLLFLQLITRLFYSVYCKSQFAESKLSLKIDKKLMREIVVFSSFVVLPGFGTIACQQGLNILLNIFGGPVANAARGVAVMLQSILLKFSQSFQQATSPQITKLYASGEFEQMHTLVIKTSKFSFYLMMIPFIPVFFEMETLLGLWLVEVPQYTVDFGRYTLILTLLLTIDYPFLIGASAEGHIGKLYTLGGVICSLVVPISYVVLKVGASLISVYVVYLFLTIVCVCLELKIGGKMFHLKMKTTIKEIIIPTMLTLVASCIVGYCIMQLFPTEGLLPFIETTVIMVISTSLIIATCGMNRDERHFMKDRILLFLKR
jgi:O-antigen/teichoic acid export membrane protein